jgi:hypothetical protein
MCTEACVRVHKGEYLVLRASYALQVDLGLCDAPRVVEQNARRASRRDLLRQMLHLL